MRRVIFATLVLIGAIGLSLTLVRRPSVPTGIKRSVNWTSNAPTTPFDAEFAFDAGTVFGVTALSEMTTTPAATDGKRWLALPPEVEGCALVGQAGDGARHLLVFQYRETSPGVTFELLETTDDGRSFEYLGSVPVVNFGTLLTSVDVNGSRIELVVEPDPESPIAGVWLSPIERLNSLVHPVLVEPGGLALVSTNRGRSFRLMRR